jgi:spore coat polysaccharide biosynthesis predicted glycosyltransferase SpsG
MECDAAWVAGGDTCLESLYTGTPTFIVSTIDYEARTADRLEAVGAAVHVGSIESASPAALLDRIFTLQENPEKIEQLHKNALTVIDGRGIARIADAIENKHRALFSTKTPGVTAT